MIYNCVSPNFVPVEKEFNSDKPVLLQLGVKPSKNLHRMIEAIQGINCKRSIVGRPPAQTLALLEKYNIDFVWKEDLTQQLFINHLSE